MQRLGQGAVLLHRGAANATLRSLEKSGILRLERQEVFRRVTVEAGERATPPVLNAEQQAAFEGLDALAAAGRPAAALLYGVTGSGKTQVYLRLIYEALAGAVPPWCWCPRSP